MAKQKGSLKLKGTLGDITFYKSKDGFLAREKGDISADRIKKDPAFQRTRENGAEFGRAGKASKLVRSAFRSLLQNAADSKLTSRLVKEMMRVVQADATNNRGERNVIDGEIELIEGFDFNVNSLLSTTLFAPFTATINRATGQLVVNLPAFIPINMVAAPSGATHFKIVSSGAEIDFEKNVFTNDQQETAELPWDSNATAVINLQNNITANSTHPLLLLLGVNFFQFVNGKMYSLKNGAFNALAIVKVSGS